MNNIKQRLNEISVNGYKLNFSDVINASIENYKKIAVNAGIAFLIFSIVITVIFAGMFGAIFGFSSMAGELSNFNLTNFSTSALIGYLFAVVIIAAFIAPFYCGIIKMAQLADKNQEFSIATSFNYYKGNYFKEILIAAVIITLFSTAITTILQFIGVSYIGNSLTYLISFFTFLVNPMIIFGNLKAFEAINASLMVVAKQAPVLICLLAVSLIICCLGLIGLCIGIFFTFPFIFSVYYIIYKQIFGINLTSEIDEIGSFQE